MGLQVERTNIWAASIDDRPGALAEKLSALSEAGANLEFVIARRTPERRGKGVVFVTPLKGAKELRAAKRAGFARATSLHSLRAEGPDKPGAGAKVAAALAEAGINLRGLSAAAIRRRFVCHLAFDKAADAAKAARILRKL